MFQKCPAQGTLWGTFASTLKSDLDSDFFWCSSVFDDEPAEPEALRVYVHKRRHTKSSLGPSIRDAYLLAPHQQRLLHRLSIPLSLPPSSVSAYLLHKDNVTAIWKSFLQILRLVTVNHLGQAVCFHNTLPITATIFVHKHVFPFSILTHFSSLYLDFHSLIHIYLSELTSFLL